MDIVIAIALLGGLGLTFGLILAAASKVFYVETDPRLDQLNACLPGANCGGCGYAGCAGYAEAVLKGEAPIGLCASGGNASVKAMSKIMGIKAKAMTRKVALVHCSGYRRVTADGKELGAKYKGIYEGIEDCSAAGLVAGHGPLVCMYGCLGYGNCVKVCKYNALSIVDGVAKVNKELCVGCGACTKVCPRGLIGLEDYEDHTIIACHSHARGAAVTRGCTQGCIGCGLCTKICPNGAITVVQNLATIDYSKCVGCGLCATVCPKKLIKSHVSDASQVDMAKVKVGE